ncbi:MAG: 2-amino-4-hydroxy-6-hydroxymethyldihydropteridine diphosphokinase [Mycobacteriaceae bacterium]|nr:2-amino-4-hydroxy-6-hydroxymethyldihydropteridine diphosphokinase [Mycobacteriaceae bacterium]
MTRVVLSVGSNLGDRLAWLQTVVDRAGTTVRAVSPVYETDPWGDLEQSPFLNAVLIAEDPARDGHDWLRFGQESERAADRVRGRRWGPRTLDVDLVACYQTTAAGSAGTEVISTTADLTLPHPLAHLRAFVLVPWLAVDPDAELTVAGQRRPVVELLTELEPIERAGVRPTAATLNPHRR